MAPITASRLLREMILLEQWQQVAVQLDLLPSHAVARCLSGLNGRQLMAVFAELPVGRHPAVFAHMATEEQALLLAGLAPGSVRRLLRGLLPEHRAGIQR